MHKDKEERVKKAKERNDAYALLTLDQKIKKLLDAGYTGGKQLTKLLKLKEEQTKTKE